MEFKEIYWFYSEGRAEGVRETMNEAHHFQHELIQSEAREEKTETTVLHPIHSITVKFTNLYKKINAKGEHAACVE